MSVLISHVTRFSVWANEQLTAEGVHAQREAAPRRDGAVRGAEGKQGPKSFQI